MFKYAYIFSILTTFSSIKCAYFEVEMTEGRQIEGNGLVSMDLKVQKINKTTYAIGGIVTLNTPIDDNYQLRTLLFKKQGNEYRLTPFHIGPHKFCDYIKNRALVYNELSGCTDFPERNICPWPAKTFTVTKCLAPTDKVPKYLSGDYRADVEILKDENIMGGYQIFFYVISVL